MTSRCPRRRHPAIRRSPTDGPIRPSLARGRAVPRTRRSSSPADWPVRPESQVVVEQTETETAAAAEDAADLAVAARAPRARARRSRRLLLLLADDDEPAATTTAATTTATAETTVEQRARAGRRRHDVVGGDGDAPRRRLRGKCGRGAVGSAERHRSSRRAPPAGKRRAGGLDGAAERGAARARRRPCRRRPTSRPRPRRPRRRARAGVVPDVVGEELADAARAFNDEGLKVSVLYVPSDEPQGRVVAQAQPAAPSSSPGDTVQVNVSNGPEPAADTAVPDVAGLQQAAGRDSSTRAGFEVLAIEIKSNRHGAKWSRSPWSRSRPPAALRSRAARSCCSTSRARLTPPSTPGTLSRAAVSGPGPGAVPPQTCRGQDPARPKRRGYFGAGSSL